MRLSIRVALFGLVSALCLALAGCGGSSNPAATGIRLSPASATIPINTTQQFTAFLTGGNFDTIKWSVVGGATNGSISSDGLYTAPATPGDYVVDAALSTNPAIKASAPITVSPGVSVNITTRTLPRVLTLSSVTLAATVSGTTATGVAWSVTQGDSGGSISSVGVYTAPAAPGTYEVMARSVADPSKRDTIRVTVVSTATVRLSIAGKGDVELQLNPVQAPITSANFVTLVNKGFYDGIKFHRYVAGFVIQGGDPLTKTLPIDDPAIGTGGPGYTIPFESNSLLHLNYALAMASTGARTGGGSQFYICLADQPSLDGNYAVFGMTTSGQAIVDALRVGDTILSAITIP